MSLTFPVAGPVLYFVFGINRIRTRAKRLAAPESERVRHREGSGAPSAFGQPDRGRRYTAAEAIASPDLRKLARVSHLVTELPARHGQTVELLENGEGAFPAMLEAIRGATESVYLATYIFESNRSGLEFVEALADAQARGVRVRVLLDGVGELYSSPRVRKILRKRGVTVARFLPPRLFPPQFNINLRNHRKILVADGLVAFTGGMNIGDRNMADEQGNRRTVDVHFRLDGPIAADIEAAFREDWEFVTGEDLPASTVPPHGPGEVHARAIMDGPDEDLDKLQTIIIGALGCARDRVVIATPYFLPSRELLSAMKAATLRGIRLTVLLPGRNNLPFVHWASRNVLWELLHWDVEVFYQPPPFAHTKLLLVDDGYVQIGSANLDPRSLRLNFELSVELYDEGFAGEIDAYLQDLIRASEPVTLEQLDARPLWQRLRDAAFWLASPYL